MNTKTAKQYEYWNDDLESLEQKLLAVGDDESAAVREVRLWYREQRLARLESETIRMISNRNILKIPLDCGLYPQRHTRQFVLQPLSKSPGNVLCAMKLHDGRKLRSGYRARLDPHLYGRCSRSRRIVWRDRLDTERNALQNEERRNDPPLINGMTAAQG